MNLTSEFLGFSVRITSVAETETSLMKVSAASLIREISHLRSPQKAANFRRFFKTGPGEYGEGDKFLGVSVPDCRSLAKSYRTLSLDEIEILLQSPFHEVRFCGVIILVWQFENAKKPEKEKMIFNFYLREIRRGHINNWDLIDVSAPMLGRFLVSQPNSQDKLLSFSHSRNLWLRRAAIVFTFAFLKKENTQPTLLVATELLQDCEDLIQKSVGWLLREVGKIDSNILRNYLEKNGKKMARMTVRYSIEKFSLTERKKWLEVTRNSLKSSTT